MKGVMKFGKKEKQTQRYIGPFEILDRVGSVSYKLALPPHLSQLHLVFHISLLRKYIPDVMHVLSMQEIIVKDDLSCQESPIAIIDR